MCFKCFGVLYREFLSTSSIASVDSVRTASARTRRVPKYPQYVQYTASMKYTSTVCAPFRQFSCSLFGTKHSQIVPRLGVGAHYFRWWQLDYLNAQQYFDIFPGRDRYCEYSLKLLCTAGIACTPRGSCFGTTGTYLPVLSGFGTAHNTLIAVSIWFFSVVTIFSPPVLYYSQYSDYGSFSSIYLWSLLMLPWAPRKKYFGGIYVVCVIYYSTVHEVL